jgi:PAS domain S-box-containing protein
MFDRDMRYLAVSRRFLDDYHLAERDLIGRCHYEVFPANHDHWRAIHRRCLAGESQRCEEEAFRRADGSVHWLRWEVRPWHTAAGAVGGVILFSECINARKQGEHELRLAKAEAEQANHAKSRFLAAASHDLRQPLAALALYVGALKNKLAPADAPLLGNMVDCVANLNELLTDLLDISKLDAGVVQPDVCDFAVADLLAGLAAVHAPEARRKGLRYRQREPALHARTDPRLLRRIVGNLLANAVRYTERGGVLVGCRRRGGKNWIEVWDSGIGVPQDKHDEIFQEFRQLGHDERNRGSGLSLAIAAKSAALLGLQIRVRSRPARARCSRSNCRPAAAARWRRRRPPSPRRRAGSAWSTTTPPCCKRWPARCARWATRWSRRPTRRNCCNGWPAPRRPSWCPTSAWPAARPAST